MHVTKAAGIGFTFFQSAEKNGWVLAFFFSLFITTYTLPSTVTGSNDCAKRTVPCSSSGCTLTRQDMMTNAENVTDLPHLTCPTLVTKIYSRTNQNN